MLSIFSGLLKKRPSRSLVQRRRALFLSIEALEDRSLLAVGDLLHTLLPVSSASGDQFGSSVAASGNYLVVGARMDDVGASDAGSAYVYDLSSATPTTPIATLHNPSPAGGDQFGISVAVSGNYVVVGADHDDTGGIDAGSAYVYDLSSATPSTPIATLNNPSPNSGDWFGFSVAISGDYVVVGAFFDDTVASDAGSAYVYDLSSATPNMPVATLNNPFPAGGDWFGYDVAANGNYVVVTALFDDAGAPDAGSAYVYDLSSATPSTPIVTLNNPSPAASDLFGISAAASGNYVVVGAYLDDTGAFDASSAYVYDLSSATPSTPIVTLNNPSPAGGDQFGYSVDVSGNYVVVGENGDNTGGADAGLAHVYDLSSVTPTTPIATLNNPLPAASDQFGFAVAVSGNFVVVGALYDDTQNPDQGAAYVFGSANNFNLDPTPEDDVYEVTEDATLVVNAAAGVLVNDMDPDLNVLSVSQVLSGPSSGTLSLSADGSFSYVPFADFNGIDHFSYEVSDGEGGFATAMVTINVLSTEQQMANVFNDVEALVALGILNNGQGNSLTSKLNNANKKFDQGKTNAGINSLEAFIQQINAFINAGILDDDEGEELIDQVLKIIVSAG